jgi:hypothetical protein
MHVWVEKREREPKKEREEVSEREIHSRLAGVGERERERERERELWYLAACASELKPLEDTNLRLLK